MRFFILNYSRGPNWLDGQPLNRQPLGPHLAYLKGLYEKSVLVIGGPLAEAPGGVAVLQTDSPEEALAAAEADPGVVEEVLRVQVLEWRPLVWERLSLPSVEFARQPASVSFTPPAS